MNNFLKKNRIALAIAVYFVIFGGLFYWATDMLVAKIQDTNDQIQTQQLSAQIKAAQIDDIPKMQQQSDEIASGKDTLNGMFLDRNDAVSLIEQLETIAQQSNVDVKISVQDQQAAATNAVPVAAPVAGASKTPATVEDSLPSKNYLKFTLAMAGSYGDIVNFMSKIENMPYYGDIISVDIKHADPQQTSAPTVSSTTLNPFANNSALQTGTASSDKVVAASDNKIAASVVTVFYLK